MGTLHEVQQLDRLAVFSSEELEDETARLGGRPFEHADVLRQTAERKLRIEKKRHDVRRRVATTEGEIEGAIVGFVPMEEGAFEIPTERTEQPSGQHAFEGAGGLGAMGLGDGEHDQEIRASVEQGALDGNRVHDAAIHVEALADAHRIGVKDRQSGAGFERGEQIELMVMAAEEDFAPGLNFGRDDVERRSILAHAIEIEPFSAGDDLLEEEVHVHDFPQARGIDEAAIGDVLVVDRGAEGSLSGQEVRTVDGSRRSAVDGVEGLGEAELLQSDNSAGAGDAAHGAALKDARRFERTRSPPLRFALELALEDVVKSGLWPKAGDAI